MSDIQPIKAGEITEAVINALGLSIAPCTPIYIGQSNIDHMKKKHPVEYIKYGSYIPEVIKAPDYVGVNPKDKSIEYVKDFPIDNDYVKVAVRVSKSGTHFARSIYILKTPRVHNFIAKGTLRKP